MNKTILLAILIIFLPISSIYAKSTQNNNKNITSEKIAIKLLPHLENEDPKSITLLTEIVKKEINKISGKYLIILNIYFFLLAALFLTVPFFIFAVSFKYYKVFINRIFKRQLEKGEFYVTIIETISLLFYLFGGWILFSLFSFQYFNKKELRIYFSLLFFIIIFSVLFYFLQPFYYEAVKPNQTKLLNIYLSEKITQDEIVVVKKEFNDSLLKDLILSRFYQAHSKYEKAQFYLESAVRKGMDTPEIHNNLGNLYFSLGKIEKAKEHYDIGLEYNPNDPILKFNMSQYYLYIGDIESAKAFYQQISEKEITKYKLPKFSDEEIVLKDENLERSNIIKQVFSSIFSSHKKNIRTFNLKIPIYILFFIITFTLIGNFIPSVFPLSISYTNCKNCNTPIIPKSFIKRVLTTTYCFDCSSHIQQKIENPSIIHSKTVRLNHLRALFFNFVFPGFGFIFTNRTLIGTLHIFMTLIIILPILLHNSILTYSPITAVLFRDLAFIIPYITVVSTLLLLIHLIIGGEKNG